MAKTKGKSSDVNMSDLAEDTVGLGNVFTDIFGLNADGLRTIFVLFKDPASYFQAAKLKEWPGFFRPSIRVYLSILFISSGMRYLWEADASPMIILYSDLMQQIADGIQEGAASTGKELDFSTFDPIQSAKTLFKYYLIALPLLYICLVALLAVIYRFWDEKLSYVIRLRYLFAILIPSSFVGMASALFAPIIPSNVFQILSFVFLALMCVMYFVTAYRGAYAYSKGSRFWRSMTITFIMFIVMMGCTILALIIAMVPTIKTTFPI